METGEEGKGETVVGMLKNNKRQTKTLKSPKSYN